MTRHRRTVVAIAAFVLPVSLQAVVLDRALTGKAVQQLRAEIAVNLKSAAASGRLDRALVIHEYELREGDNFFVIMARTSMDAETLASLNDLPNPNAITPGQKLKIPNARGIFVRGERDEVARTYGVPVSRLLAVNDRWFLPGHRFSGPEMKFFRGEAFSSPLLHAKMTSGFGSRFDPFTKRGTFHGGIDLAAEAGTEVRSSAPGVVVFAGVEGGYGNLVIVEHEHGYHTYYGHLSKIKVKKGDKLKTGDVLGLVGSTGRSTGPHLHFEVRRYGRAERPRIVHQ